MTKDEFIILAKQEVKGLSSYLVNNDYENAADDASRETGWVYPVSGNFQIYWVKQRVKRHLFFYLYTESAHKFKYKQINLQHRFEHYHKMLFGKDGMDAKFAEAIEERPDLFAGVSISHLFGTKVDAGFAYQSLTGKDITYRDTQKVAFGPKAAD